MTLSGEGLVGRTIGDFEVLRVLGRGGMGTVYEAVKSGGGRFALKVPHDDLLSDEEYVRRFYHEAKVAQGIKHPHIVETFEIKNEGDHHYIAMELVRGRPLSMIIKRATRLDLKTAIRYALHMTAALDALERRNIVHCDIKPKNIIIDEVAQTAKLMDFGIARIRKRGREDTGESNTDLIGSKYYLAPEQIRGERTDHRTDIYALGVTLFEMIAGKVPYESDSAAELARKILEDPAPEIALFNRLAPPELQEILDMAMAKDPADRYRHVSEFEGDLNALQLQPGLKAK